MSPPGGPLCPPVLLALLLGLPRSSGSLQCQDQVVSTAAFLCLVPEKPPWEWTEINWSMKKDERNRQRILTASSGGSVSYTKGRFHGRANFQRETLSLCLSPVLKEDSGVYRVEFENPTGALTPQCFRVSVWDPIPQPALQTQILDRDHDWCHLSVLCSGPGNVSYSWDCPGDPAGIEGDPEGIEEDPSRLLLRIPQGPEPQICLCNLSNPAGWSWESSGGSSSCTQGPFPEPPSPSNTTSLASTSDAPEVIGVVGGSVTFRSQIPAVGAAFWTFGSNSIATVPPGNPPLVLFADKKYRTRFNFSENGLTLTISQLSLEDAGIYYVKIDGRTSSFTLRVYRELLEPTVTCEAQNCSAGSCFFSLRCSTPGVGFGNVSYFWSRGEQLDEGPTVWVDNKSSGSNPESLTCTAQNPVSSRNVTVPNPGELCADPGSLGRVVAVAVGEAAVLSSIFLGFYCKDQWEARLSSSRA